MRTYLAERDISAKAFGDRVGASERAVIKWMRDERVPGRQFMAAIVRETNGEVTPNDFFDVPQSGEAA